MPLVTAVDYVPRLYWYVKQSKKGHEDLDRSHLYSPWKLFETLVFTIWF